MTEPTIAPVRPTKRCLDDLDLPFPVLTAPLWQVPHDIVKRAQAIPQEVDAGGAERIRALDDRVWFKCKTSNRRAIVTRLSTSEREDRRIVTDLGEWWIGAAGFRQQDSAGDFYKTIEAEAIRYGKGSGGASTAHLLPVAIDVDRLQAELAAQAVEAMRRVVVTLIARSLCEGKPYSAEFSGHRVTAHVRAADGSEAYLAIVAEGHWDPRILATILSSVPGISPESWQPEPSEVAGITPESGQIIWSTIIPPEVQAKLLDLALDDQPLP